MGYRSNVVICAEKAAYDRLLKVCKENNFMPDEIFEHDNNPGEYALHWEAVKWYDGYEEIDAIMDELRKFNDELDDSNREEAGLRYLYMREGEETGDFEGESNEYGFFSVYPKTGYEFYEMHRIYKDSYAFLPVYPDTIAKTINDWLTSDISKLPSDVLTDLMALYGKLAGKEEVEA